MLPSLPALLARLFLPLLALLAYAPVRVDAVASTSTYDPMPFSFIGKIQAMTLNNASDVLSGGTLTVNTFHIIVPKNLLVNLPSITVAWSELFAADGSLNLPGFGVHDWEVTVYGNNVAGVKIAGVMNIFQETFLQLQGFITAIDYPSGHFKIENTEAVLNDPLGRYGVVYDKNPLWTVDPDNPSIHAATGFPLCIPRNATDAECPLTNRPTDINGLYLTAFTMPAPSLAQPNGLNPNIMVPLVVGDYITYSGVIIPKGANDGVSDLLAVYSLAANIGIYTVPGTQPAYINVDAAQYAIVVGDATVESDETRATTFSTDQVTSIQWFAMDVNPCTGETTERNLLLVQPADAAPVGEGLFRLGKTDVSPPTRQVGFRYANGVVDGPRGLIAGQFIQPIMNYIFPELIVYGDPNPALQFNLMPFLSLGSGPFEFGNFLAEPLATPTIVKQLSPWPGNPIPSTTSCPAITASPSGTGTSSAPATTTTAKAGPDTVLILSATMRNQKGSTTTTVTAVTSSLLATLFLTVVGVTDTVANQTMQTLGQGEWTLAVVTDDKPVSVSVLSSGGGTASSTL